MNDATFHDGELAVQRRLGVADEIGPWAKQVVRSHLPEAHRRFYRELPFVVAAARDGLARPWATILAAEPGFLATPEPDVLEIGATPVAGDALEHELVAGRDLGLLGIELATRRRNRVNGRLAVDSGRLALRVDQAFGNCPQYIRERAWRWVGPSAAPREPRRSRALTEDMRNRIENADTFFIASGHRGEGQAAAFGMDASHRGGARGFVRVDGRERVVFPDFAGNNHFNTVGNLLLDDRVGLLFVDFETGGMLQLTGRARIDWDSPEVRRFPGAQRLVWVDVDEVVDLPEALPLRWINEGDAVRSLRVVDKRRESDDVVSLSFAARDGGALPDFEPGQHLPIEITLDGGERLQRTYSLSSAPDDEFYRISVKREPLGKASRHVHDRVAVGDFAQARDPAGDFVLEAGARPVVLLSAGIGITPMLSMLRHLVLREDPRQIVFVRVARDGIHDPHREEIGDLVRASRQISSHAFYSQPRTEDRSGLDFDAAGRLDAARLRVLLPSSDIDAYVCGPVAFMAAVRNGLRESGIDARRVHVESFGPQSAPTRTAASRLAGAGSGTQIC